MKKVTLAVAVALLLGGAMFGQAASAPTPTISTEVNDGVIYSNTSSGGVYKDYGIDYGSGNAGGTVMVTFALTGANYAYSIAPTYKGTAGFTLDHAWAAVTPVAGFTTYAGVDGNNAPFGDLDDEGDGNYSTSSLGAWFTNSGFSVGAQVGEIAGTSTSAIPVWAAVNYSLDKVFVVNVYGTNGQNSSLDAIHVTGSLLAVTNLKLTAGFNGYSLSASSSDSHKGFIDATAAYAVTSAFSVGATGYYNNVIGKAIADGNQWLVYKPFVSYAITPLVAVSAYLIGDTSSKPNYEPEGQVAWTPVSGVTIKGTVWYDTDSGDVGYTGIHSNYVGDLVKSTSGQFNAAVDAKLVF